MKVLDLRYNKINDAAALAGASKVNKTLEELHLYLCGITDATDFVDTLKEIKHLKVLELGNNYIPKDQKAILRSLESASLKIRHLKDLDLHLNEIRSSISATSD